MLNNNDSETNPSPPGAYQIRFKGYLDADWSEWLGGLTVALEDDHTLLTGQLDQAALHGLLKKVRDLGLTLVSVNPVDKTERE